MTPYQKKKDGLNNAQFVGIAFKVQLKSFQWLECPEYYLSGKNVSTHLTRPVLVAQFSFEGQEVQFWSEPLCVLSGTCLKYDAPLSSTIKRADLHSFDGRRKKNINVEPILPPQFPWTPNLEKFRFDTRFEI